MRWRFPHPGEDASRELVTGRIDSWWREFVAATPKLEHYFHGGGRWDLAGWMREHLGVVDDRIMWEFGPGTRDAGGQRLVLTPEAEHRLRPLVDVVLARAPKLDGWEFHPHRLAEDLSQALRAVAERTSMDFGGWQAYADLTDEGLVDVMLSAPFALSEREEARAAAMLLIEALVGEELMDVWIGNVEIGSHTGSGPMGDLAPVVRALIEAQRARLPKLPYWRRAHDGPWTLLRLAPRAGLVDFPGQQDMLIAKTMDLDLWKALHGQRPFYSRRFSRCGEVMATLKIDGATGLSEDGLVDKANIEDVIAGALEPLELGGQIGGGTGLRYSYIDLALTNVEDAMDALIPVLRAGKLPRRTWLLFFDADLGDEWIPLWDDAPPPPR
jgi:hypothetical protein